MPSPAKFGDGALHNIFLTTAGSDADLVSHAATASSQITSQPPGVNQIDEATMSLTNINDQALHDTFMAMTETDPELAIYAAIDNSLTSSQQSEVDQNGASADINTSRSPMYPILQKGSEDITGSTRPHATVTNVTASNNVAQGWIPNAIIPLTTPTIARDQPAFPTSYASVRFATITSPGLRQQGSEPLNEVTHSLPVEQPLSTAAGAERGTQSLISKYCPPAAKTQSSLSAPTSTASYTANSLVNGPLTPTGHLNLTYSFQNQHIGALGGVRPASTSPYALIPTAEYFKFRGIPAPQGNTPCLSERSLNHC